MRAALRNPKGIVVTRSGALYIADSGFHRIRRISSDGTIQSVSGNGTAGFQGDGRLAVSALLNSPQDVAVDNLERLIIADGGNNRIRHVETEETLRTVAGGGQFRFSGDGAPALSAVLDQPSSIARDSDGNLFIADSNNSVVRRISADGTITTVAGTGEAGYAGDGAPARSAKLNYPGELQSTGTKPVYRRLLPTHE
ncbi:MAG: hypothetical protein IPJ98_26485 [Bryobacterales bacterium]|nr:hypothetical protein [Bryobacterales bacterium]